MSEQVLPSDYALLLLLQIVDREIDNTELERLFGVRLLGPAYKRLSDGFVESDKTHRPYRLKLAAKGVRALRTPPTEVDASLKTVNERIFWAALMAQHQNGSRSAPPEIEPADLGSLDERVRAAYGTLTEGRGGYVNLADLRPLFPDVAKADLDKALEQMLDAQDVRLEPEIHRHRVDARVKAAAVRIGGEDLHKMAIGLR